MNLTSKEKNKKPQNNTYFSPEYTIPELQSQVQYLYYIETNRTKVPKGVKQILQERGYYINKTKLRYSPRCPKALLYLVLVSNKPLCCLAYILSNYKNFYKQRSAIKTLIKGRGYKYLFLPKFYYELNPIEMYWGYTKA